MMKITVKSNYPRLTSKLLALSTADDYEDAKLEWRITGNVWRKSSGEIPHHPSGHNNHCLCGHPIVYHFEIENTKTNVLEIVGSTCISNWMILRHMSEKLAIPKNTITEEMIDEWKREAVQGLIKEAWWESPEGKNFTSTFNEIKDLDLRINIRETGKTYFDKTLQKFVSKTEVKKRATGNINSFEYGMASIVWRWNHPDNPKAQIKTLGYPNDRLLSDLYRFHFFIKEHKKTVADEDMINDARKEVLEDASPKFNRALAKSILGKKKDMAFMKICENRQISYFDVSFASNEWEAEFIKRMRLRVIDGEFISDKQSEVLLKIVKNHSEMASEKQINYLKHLKYEGDYGLLTKNVASKEIERLTKGSK
tara:strand:+ start:5321 stop:6421 length:1101 start_codon:yes stop_codon:yes gene_type:complete